MRCFTTKTKKRTKKSLTIGLALPEKLRAVPRILASDVAHRMSSKLLAAALNSVGLLLSVFLTLQRFGWVGTTALCELGSSLSCSAVMTSPWAVLFGVPVAVLGVVYFVLAGACSLLVLGLTSDFRAKRDAAVANVIVTGMGVLSVAYFVAAEVAVGSMCPLCTVVHLIALATFVLAWRHLRTQGSFVWSFGVLLDVAAHRSAFVIIAIVVLLVPLVVFNLPVRKVLLADSDVAALAGCLAARRVTMYGTSACSHCIAQKSLFGQHFARVPFVDCEASPQVCQTATVKGYPTWVSSSSLAEQRKEGVVGLRELAKWAGCAIDATREK